jgi:transcription regulator MmyB-like protein
MTGAPAFVRNARLDILAANALGYALYSEVFVDPARPASLVRFAFLDPRAKTFYPDWEVTASNSIALLRTAAALRRGPSSDDNLSCSPTGPRHTSAPIWCSTTDSRGAACTLNSSAHGSHLRALGLTWVLGPPTQHYPLLGGSHFPGTAP